MKWFKHMSAASRDSFIVELEAIFGLEGYARWWKMLEIVAEQSDPEKGRWSVSYPNSIWCSFLKCKPKVLLSFLVHSQNQGRINWKQNGNISEIEVCNMRTIRDNYAKDLQVAGKKLAPNLEGEVEVEQKEIKNPLPPTGSRVSVPPKIEWVEAYCEERQNGINPQQFFDHYATVNWHRKKVKIKDWQSCVRTWEQQRKNGPDQGQIRATTVYQQKQVESGQKAMMLLEINRREVERGQGQDDGLVVEGRCAIQGEIECAGTGSAGRPMDNGPSEIVRGSY